MTTIRRVIFGTLVLAVAVITATVPRTLGAAGNSLPSKLTDQEFWRLTEDLSEPNGYFRSDNLLSNEIWFQWVIPLLVQRTEPGGVYMGVGPEQNFTYIAAIKPKMAFIPDIRRGNLDLQLMYKAVFELSDNRADFVARLFTKRRPAGLDAKSTASEIFEAFSNVETGDEDNYKDNLKEITDHLVNKRHLPLSSDDLSGINYVYHNFYMFGPRINYNSSQGNGFGGGNFVSYADLMTATDQSHVSRSFLSSEESFKVVKNLEEKNLIVPLVGDLSGPKAVRSLGKYVRDHKATIAAFYLSNVEQYLSGSGTWVPFCRNVATLPLDERSTFIRSTRTAVFGNRGGLMSVLGEMKAETDECTVAETSGR